MKKYDFDLCKASCSECSGINVTALHTNNLYICKDTEKILERIDDTTLKELGMDL
jgi:hypothetical protein